SSDLRRKIPTRGGGVASRSVESIVRDVDSGCHSDLAPGAGPGKRSGSTMRSFTRFGAGLASALVVGAFVAGPASAAGRAETFLGNATGTALHLNLFGTDLTEGFSKA